MDSTSIVARIQQSDKSAFNELFGHFYSKLCRFAYVIVQDGDVAEEIVQDVFVRLWNSRDRFSFARSIDSYLFISVRNAAISNFRQSQTRQKYESDTEPPEPSVIFDSDEFMKHLQKAIERLPEQCRMIYHLKNFEGLTYAEIAEYLEISDKTAENQMRIALSKLKTMLEPYKTRFWVEN